MAISIRGPGGWQRERGQAELRRMQEDGWNGCPVRGGACSVSTSVQLTPPPPPSSPALGYRASPKVSSCQTGQDLDLVAAHGEPRYDIGIGFGLAPLARWPLLLSSLQCLGYLGAVPPAGSGSLGHVGAFPCSRKSKFSSSFHLEYPACTHTHTRTRMRTSFLFLSQNIPLSHPPRPRRLDLPPRAAATPNVSISAGAHAAAGRAVRVELLRSLRLSVFLAPRRARCHHQACLLATAMSVTKDGQREGFT